MPRSLMSARLARARRSHGVRSSSQPSASNPPTSHGCTVPLGSISEAVRLRRLHWQLWPRSSLATTDARRNHCVKRPVPFTADLRNWRPRGVLWRRLGTAVRKGATLLKSGPVGSAFVSGGRAPDRTINSKSEHSNGKQTEFCRLYPRIVAACQLLAAAGGVL